MEHWRAEDRPKRDAADLLLNGFWTSTRAQKPPSSSSVDGFRAASRDTNHSRSSSSIRTARKGWPPPPSVEDEASSIAKEVKQSNSAATVVSKDEIPFRGAIDQYPIVLEASISDSDLTRLEKDGGGSEHSNERRFVHVPTADHGPRGSASNGDPRGASSQTPQGSTRDKGEQRHTQSRPRQQGTRHDLPHLTTDVSSDAPQFQRSPSTYAFVPTKQDDGSKPPRSPSAEHLAAKGPDSSTKSYFDTISQSLPRKYSSNSRPTSPLDERRERGTAASAYKPPLEKRQSTGYDVGPQSRRGGQDGAQSNLTGTTERLPQRTAYRPQGLSGRGDSLEGSRQARRSMAEGAGDYRSGSEDHDSSDSARPVHRRHASRVAENQNLHAANEQGRHQRSRSPSGRPPLDTTTARYASPLPSPRGSPNRQGKDTTRESREGATTNLRSGSPRRDGSGQSRPSLNPNDMPSAMPRRSRSRSRSRHPSPPLLSQGSVSLPILTTFAASRGDPQTRTGSRNPPTNQQYVNDKLSQAPTGRVPMSQPQHWQPPVFVPQQDSSSNRVQPVGSYRRHSEDVDRGHVTPLPPCPRTTPVRGYTDWMTLPRSADFYICPSCFQSAIAPTEFRTHFIKAPVRSNDVVACDFGRQPWYRIAWLLTRKEERRDLGLLEGIAGVSSRIPPCPGRRDAVRKFYSILYPDTNRTVPNFHVCQSCVWCVETLLPSLKGILVRVDHLGPPGVPRPCDLRFESKRFVHYFDALENLSDLARNERGPPKTNDFVDLAHGFSVMPECRRDDLLQNARWHIIAQLPEFTVCQECFDEVALPDVRRKAIPEMLNNTQMFPLATCQLYSPRMRAIFREAVDNDDYRLLASRARERKRMEKDLKEELAAELRRSKPDLEEIRIIEDEWRKWE